MLVKYAKDFMSIKRKWLKRDTFVEIIKYSTLINNSVGGGTHDTIESARESAKKRGEKAKQDCHVISIDGISSSYKIIETIKYEKPKGDSPMEYKGKDSQGNYIYEYKYKRKKAYKGAKNGTN